MSNIEIIGNNTNTMVVLESNDKIKYSIDIDTIKHSITIKNMLEDTEDDGNNIYIPNIKSDTFKKVLIFCDYIQNNNEDLQALNTWAQDRTYTIPLSQWFTDYINIQYKELLW
jgi:adenylate cyclase